MTRRGSSVSAEAESLDETAPRTASVLAEGNLKASLLFVGESGGATEDMQGRPFVGPSGQLLGKMIEAMGLRREDVYIVSIENDAATSCAAELSRQIQSVQPKIVVALGDFAARVLLQTDQSFTELRGGLKRYATLSVMPTFHPSHLLKTPEAKREAWADLLVVARELGITVPKRGGGS